MQQNITIIHLVADHDEFIEDLKRFKYVKRLVNRYIESGYLADRLILNHLIVLHNVFGVKPTVEMLKIRLDKPQWPIIKPFLIYLRMIDNTEIIDVTMDETVVQALRNI